MAFPAQALLRLNFPSDHRDGREPAVECSVPDVVQGEEARESCSVVGGNQHRAPGTDRNPGIVSMWLRKGFGFAGAWTVREQNQLLGVCFGLPAVNKI